VQISGALLDIGWEELDAAVAKQARLKKSQRELGMKLNELEQETTALQEVFVRTAQDLYDAMSAGELDNAKAEKQVNDKADKLRGKLGELESEKADTQRRLEALRRSLEASDGELERVLKMGAPEQSLKLSGSILEAASELEQRVFAAQEASRKVRDSYFGLQALQRYQGRGLAWNLRQIGSGGGSFGSVPEIKLGEALQGAQEIGAVVDQAREAVESGEDAPVPALGENVTVTARGTVGVFLPDDD
jgi:chromosome segregation ATPase